MSDVAACGYSQSTYIPVLEKTYTQIHDMLPHRS